jgi:predicted nucleotidyltransferase
VGRDESVAAIERFRRACVEHPLVVAAFLGGSYAAGLAREDSDIDLYVVTEPGQYAAFLEDRRRFMDSWGTPTHVEDVWNFEGLGFDMIVFELDDGVHGEVALGTTERMMKMHGGPHDVLVDKTGVLAGISFPGRTPEEPNQNPCGRA